MSYCWRMLIRDNQMHLALTIVCLAVAGPALGVTALSDTTPASDHINFNYIPISYSVRLGYNTSSLIINGSILMDFRTTSNKSYSLNYVSLHIGQKVEVDFNSFLLFNDSTTLRAGAMEIDDDQSRVTFKMEYPYRLEYGKYYMLACKFTSILNNEPKGLFTGFYNSTSPYVAMNLRPTHARDVFPCVDEPQFKVPVSLQVVRPATHYAVSTAPLTNSSIPDENNMVLDTFATTEPISIHALALFVSEIQPNNAMGLQLFSPPSLLPSFSLGNLLDNITALLGPFPTSTLSLVVLPDQFLTTFSSYGIVFCSPEVFTDQLPRQWSNHLLRMQFAESFLRQYLEYMKTPAWWSHLWLADSVAAFLATHLQPEVPQSESVMIAKVITRSEAMGQDNTAPLVNNQLLSRYDIENIVSNLTIRHKGLSILTMWNDTMPEGLLIKSIKQYLQLNKSVVTTEDLLEIMDANIRSDPTYNMTAAINLLPQWLYVKDGPTLAFWPQSPTNFMLSQAPGCVKCCNWAEPVSPLWPISISYTTDSDQNWGYWGHYSQASWLLSTFENYSLAVNQTLNQWTVFNLEAAPYRMDYANRWYQIVNALKTDLTQAAGVGDHIRAAIQDDAVALSLNGCVSFSTMVSVLKATVRNKLDWYTLTNALDALNSKIGDDPVHNQLMVFAESLFSPQLLRQLDLANSSFNPQMKEVRSLLTPLLCQYNIGNCRQMVVELSRSFWAGNVSEIEDSDLENVACYGARYNSEPLLSSLMNLYSSAPSPKLKRMYAKAISCISDQSSINRTLYTISSSSSPFTMTDAKYILTEIADQMENSAISVDFMIGNVATILDKLGNTFTSKLIRSMAKHRVDLSKFTALTNGGYDFDPYVMDSINLAIDKAAASEVWWSASKASLSAALPQAPTTAPPTSAPPTSPQPSPSPTPTPTSHPSGALRTVNPVSGLLLFAAATAFTFKHHF